MNKIHYSPDVDALLIELNNNPIAYAEEEGKTILHYSEDDQLVLIEILDFGCSLSEYARQELAKSINFLSHRHLLSLAVPSSKFSGKDGNF